MEAILYVDPSCPFAWITSRWLLEVAARRPLAVTMRVMSLSVLNEDRELDAWYRAFNDAIRGPARVAAAVQERHGAAAFAHFYAAYGARVHAARDEDRAGAVAAALAGVGLPPDLAAVADTAALDPVLYATHEHVRSLVGDELGTPVLDLGDAAFFGPVCAAIPRAAEALALWDAVRSAATAPSFTELKRGRTGDLVLA